MPDTELGRDAANIAYNDLEVGQRITGDLARQYPSLEGYRVDRYFGDSYDPDGLNAFALRNPDTGDIVVAFRGSLEARDWVDDASTLGWRQWEEARGQVNDYIDSNWQSGTELTFAGHSLGGGLAQYATYDAAGNAPDRRGDISMVTINGFGGRNGIEANEAGGFDPGQIRGVDAANYFNPEDRVPRLGGAHIGDTYDVGDFREGEPDGVYGAHRGSGFTDDVLDRAKAGTPDYYKMNEIQKDPGAYIDFVTSLAQGVWAGRDGLSAEEADALARTLAENVDVILETPELQRFVGDMLEGIGDDISNAWNDNVVVPVGEKIDEAWDAAYDLAEDISDSVDRGLDWAEDAAERAWDDFTDHVEDLGRYTEAKAKDAVDYLDDLKDEAIDWFDDKAEDLSDWIDDAVEGTEGWVRDKTDALGEIADWIGDKTDEFGDDLADLWTDVKEESADLADQALDWLEQQKDDLLETAEDLVDKGRDWIEDTFDDMRDRAEDFIGKAKGGWDEFTDDVEDAFDRGRDWLSDTADDFGDSVGDFWDGLSDLWNGDDGDGDPADYADDVDDRSRTARTEASPLVLDLDGDGIELTAAGSRGGVYWDIDLDGMRERTGWVHPDDGLLAIDTDENGLIDDHSELFGDAETDGFTVLAAFDSNSDGRIDQKDDAFADLLVWRDADGDGRSDAGELLPLRKAGVAAIDLAAQATDTEIAGNRITHAATYETDKGRSREIVDAWFAYSDLNTRAGTARDFDPEATALPQIRGYGRLPDMHTAMAADEALKAQMAALAGAGPRAFFGAERGLVEATADLLYRWAGVEDVDPASRGAYVDARQVAFVEAFTDRAFLQYGRADPAPEAGRTLTNAFETALNAALLRIVVQAAGDALFRGQPAYDWRSDGFPTPLRLDLKALKALAGGYEARGADMGAVWTDLIRVIDTAVDIEGGLPRKLRARLESLVEKTDGGSGITVDKALTAIYGQQGLGLNGTEGDDDLRGGGGRDNLSTGAGDDQLVGLRGDDVLLAGPGRDTLDGGPGNDLMQGEADDDTYVWRGGFDTVVDTGGADDRLRLEGNVALRELAFLTSLDNDADLEIYRSGTLIVRIEGFATAEGAVETLELRDGTIYDLVKGAQGIVGTRRDDRLEGDVDPYVQSDRIVGLGGDDLLSGGRASDVLEGGPGDDTMRGGPEGDVLIGGDGDDLHDGGAGDDRYRGGLGDDTYRIEGDDTILEEGGRDTVRLPDGVGPGRVTLFRTVNSDDLTILAGGASAVVEGHFADPAAAVERIAWEKKGRLRDKPLDAFPIETRGTETTDYLRGDEGGVAREDRLLGLQGIDRIYGYAGDDRLEGGGDDDYLYGAEGRDTLDGEDGNDSLYGGAGNDAYHARRGDDFVQDYGSEDDTRDTLVMGRGLKRKALDFARTADGDLTVSWASGSVRIDRAYEPLYAVEKIQFAGRKKAASLVDMAIATVGTEAAESLGGNRAPLGSRDDAIRALGGDDRLYGYDGADTLVGGAGDDTAYGADGGDTYRVGEGDDVVQDAGAADDPEDRIVLDRGILPGAVTAERLLDGDLLLAWDGGSVRIDNAFDARYAIETLVYGDGSTVALTDLQAATRGTNGADAVNGNGEEYGSRDDRLLGLDGDDTLRGYDGADTLEGGAGDDSLEGGAGPDTYRVGPGHDAIDEAGADGDGPDTVRLPRGVAPKDVTWTRFDDGALLIDWGRGSVRIERAFDARSAVEILRFDDGTTVDLTAVQAPTRGTGGADALDGNREETGSRDDLLLGLDGDDTVAGYDGDDTLDGGAGDDRLLGAEGADTYRVGAGYDTIADDGDPGDGPDRIELPAGVAPDDVGFERRADGSLHLTWDGGGVEIYQAFSDRYAVETLVYGDGTERDLTALRVRTVGTTGDETLNGNTAAFGSRDDDLDAGDGNDRLNGYDGRDTLRGGAGDDSSYGGTGGDTYVLGPGRDLIADDDPEGTVDDVALLPAGVGRAEVSLHRTPGGDLIVAWAGGTTEIADAFVPRYAVERLVYGKAGDGEEDLTALRVPTLGTPASERLNGNQAAYGSRDDRLVGDGGDDSLYGYDGDDTLEGGAGDDYQEGGDGADVYRVGAGHDLLRDYDAGDPDAGGDTVEMAAGIGPSDVTYARLPDGDLQIRWDAGSVRIDQALDERYAIETLRFADGTAVDLLALAAPIVGTPGNDALVGNREAFGSRDDRLEGGEGDDRLTGYDGADTLDGGDGDDTLSGGAGGDVYEVSPGDDLVSDGGAAGDAPDTLAFPAGVAPGDLSYVLRDNRYLEIDWGGGTVTVDYFTSPNSVVERASFAGGQTVDLTTVSPAVVTSPPNQTLRGDAGPNALAGGAGRDALYGYDGADSLDGGAGDDTLAGAAGADRYAVGLGDDYIDEAGAAGDGPDRVVLPAGVGAGDVTFLRLTDGDLRIAWSGGSVRIDTAFDLTSAVEILEYGTGGTRDLTTLAVPTEGTGGADRIDGNREELGSRDDDLRGLAGNDTLIGYDGADTLDGGADDDVLQGGAGADLYRVGAGHDLVGDVGAEGDGADVLALAAGIAPGDVTYARLPDGDLRIAWDGGSVRIDFAFDRLRAVETLRFADGTTVDLTALEAPTEGTDAGETLSGNTEETGSRNDRLIGRDGNDVLNGYDGADTLEGGAGDDSAYGGPGGDTYAVGAGDDFVSDAGAADLSDGPDRVVLPAGIGPEAVSYRRLPDGDLRIGWDGGSVRIDAAHDARYAVETLVFGDGSSRAIAEIPVSTWGTNNPETLNGNREETGSRDDRLIGLDGNDVLNGYDGADTLEGGAGDDSAYGGEGRDVYVVGPGADYVSDAGSDEDGRDTLLFPAGVSFADLDITRTTGGALDIDWGGGTVRVNAGFDLRYAVERLAFADGGGRDVAGLAVPTVGTGGDDRLAGNREELGSHDDVLLGFGGDDLLDGYEGDDLLVGGPGDDTLRGGPGSDRYQLGAGHDLISDGGSAEGPERDVAVLPEGVGRKALDFARLLDGDLLVSWKGGSVRIDAAFDSRAAVETLRLAGGGAIDLTTLAAPTAGTGGADRIGGNREEYGSRDDDLRGDDGDDVIEGYDGDDVLNGGLGNDTCYGGIGDDTYVASAGTDVLSERSGGGTDTIVFRTVESVDDLTMERTGSYDLTIGWSGGTVVVANQFYSDAYRIETLTLDDGTLVDLIA